MKGDRAKHCIFELYRLMESDESYDEDIINEIMSEATKDINELIEKANERDILKARVEELEKENLLTQYRLLEAYISKLPKIYRKRTMNWVIVQEFLQYYTSKQGSTSSIEKCHMLNINPDAYEIKCYYDYRKEVQDESK